MKKVASIILMALILILNFGCSEDNDDSKTKYRAPSELNFYINSDSTAIFTWKHSKDADEEHFVEYRLFRSDAPFPVEADNDSLFLDPSIGTTDSTMTAPIYDHIKKYYLIKAYFESEDGNYYSERSNIIDLAPTISGVDTLYQIGLGDSTLAGIGWDIDGATTYMMTTDNQNYIELYFGTHNADDSPGRAMLKSPRLYGTVFYESKLDTLGYGSWRYINTIDNEPALDQVSIEINQVVALKTPDNRYVKIFIDDINRVDGTDYFYTVIHYSYQSVLNYPVF
jgi:hypothetical protein